MSNSFNWKFYVHIQLSWNFVRLLITSSRLWIYHYFWFSHMFKGDNWHISWFGKKKMLFSQTPLKQDLSNFARLSLLGVDIVILGLMTLTLFQGHRCVRNITCKNCMFWIPALFSPYILWMLHALKSLCTVWFVWLWFVFKEDNWHVFYWPAV